jgi:hypothetical protein
MRQKGLKKNVLYAIGLALILFFLQNSNALAVDLADYIAGPNFLDHTLSTGEQIHFTGEGGTGLGIAARQYKNNNYEQFFIGPNGIYRREDTSGGLRPGLQEAHCPDGSKTVYTLDSRPCTQYATGDQITTDGTLWAPRNATQGSTWITQAHQILTVNFDQLVATGNRIFCVPTDFSTLNYPNACNQSNSLRLEQEIPANSFTFCTGITNPQDMVKITVTAGAGSGDTFYFMRGYGLVGFEDPTGFQAGLMGPGADGSGCGGTVRTPPTGPGINQGPNPSPKPDPYVPCNEERPLGGQQNNTEYHSLRPYQSSPCNRQTTETALFCGNALITRRTYTVQPDSPGVTSCTYYPSGDPHVCTYVFGDPNDPIVGATTGTANRTALTINLANASLPIMGNTENVPNEYNNGNPKAPVISPGQSVNNYVSWYIHGAIGTGEQNQLNTNIEQGVRKLIDYSGPLRKLLPHYIQTIERFKTIYSVDQNLDYSGYFSGFIDNLQNVPKHHNQVIGCTRDGQIVPCSTTEQNANRQERVRLGDFTESVLANATNLLNGQWFGRFPPLESMYSTSQGYFAAYNQWKSNSPWYQLWQMIPFSSTEDRIGQTFLPEISGDSAPQSTSPDLQVTNIQLHPAGQGALGTLNHRLYFAHMEEDNDLGTLLQKVYSPGGEDLAAGNPPNNTLPEFCEIADTRTNPGDNLFGNYNQTNGPLVDQNEKQVKGDLNYRTQFTCDFPEPTYNTTTDQNCLANLPPGVPADTCITTTRVPPPPCVRVVGIGFQVTTNPPKVDEIWQRLVNGNFGVFKKMFPKVGPDTPVTEIKDIPGSTKTAYGATGTDTVGLAGNPSLNRDGSQAQLFFPHIGGIYDYFLKNIQKALRPLDESSVYTNPISPLPPAATPPPGIACPTSIANINIQPPAGNCQLNCPSVPDSAIPSKYLGDMITHTRFLANYYSGTGTGNQPGIDRCYNYVVQQSIAAGINPIFTLAIWAHESAASNYPRFGCTVQDFGVNDPSIAANLQAQLARFLRLPSYYPVTYPQCFTNGCSFSNFSLIYQQGVPSSGACTPNANSENYASRLLNLMQTIAPSCSIAYPTDMNCP